MYKVNCNHCGKTNNFEYYKGHNFSLVCEHCNKTFMVYLIEELDMLFGSYS